MPRPTALAALVTLLLAAGCTAARSHPPVGPQASQPGAVSIAPAANSAGATATRTNTAAPATSTAPPAATPARSTAGRSSGPASSTATPDPGTEVVVRRPVTAQGRVAAGYTVVPDQMFGTDSGCGGTGAGAARQSPVAVDAGPVACAANVVYAVACWNAPTGHAALCYRDPWQRQVARLATAGRLTAVAPPAKPSPLGLVLGNGVRCWLRIGGAWPSLDGHPDLFGTYACQSPEVIWGAGQSDGIDRSGRLWKVWLAPGSGHGKLHPMTVRTAYFVGTART